MCGIVGVYDYRERGRSIDPALFDRMVDRLAHRGPDGRGVWLDLGLGLALGHRRLAVLDPTAAGSQPMQSPSHGLVVTYNGEIYNHRELRRQLEQHGHVFRTRCDTEVLLAAYAAWGTAALERLNGIFAFALWDGRQRRLWLVRDRLGVKPLYYTTAEGWLRFASEPKAILEDRAFARRPNRAAIDAFLTFGFVPAPQSAFDDLYQLPAAHMLVVENGTIRQQAYWGLSMTERSAPRRKTDEEFAARFGAAVSRQMLSDVPLGGFLSGGIDSAAVVAEMKAADVGPVRTFSLGFSEPSFDERSAAAETARLLGTEHTQLQIDADLEQGVERLLCLGDEPFADSSSLALLHLCGAAREHVKVALSGDGADELLAGYPTYGATVLAAGYRRLPAWSRSLLREFLKGVPVSDRRYSLHQFATRFVSGAEEPAGRDFSSWRMHFSDRDKRSLCRPQVLPAGHDALGLYGAGYQSAPGAATRLKRMLHADLTFYLPNDMLVKVDRMSMAHGLEVRVPFLDHEFVEFCAALPGRYLARLPFPGQNKLILRRHLKQRVGRPLSKRSKTGFNVPIERALRTTLRDRFHSAVTSPAFVQEGPFDVPKLRAHAERHARREIDAGHALFSALVLADWWGRWLTS